MSRAALLLVAFLVAGPAWSQADCAKREAAANDLQTALVVLYLNGCLGRDADADPLARRVGEELSRRLAEKPRGTWHSAEERRMVVVWTLDLGHQALEAARPSGDAAGRVVERMKLKVERTQAAVLDTSPQEKSPANARYWAWDTQTGRFPGALPGAPLGVDLAALASDCADAQSGACQDALQAGKLALRVATLIERAFTFQSLDTLEEARLDAARRNRMWHAYFEEARVQLPLELIINSALYRRRAKAEGGFADTPNYQVIFLHPSAGLQYVRSADAGSRFEPALVLEIAGVNGWKWKADGSMGTALGASFVVTYSDRAGARGTGAGMAFHVNNRYSIAFTGHDGRLGITLSTDLARLFTKADETARAEFRLGKCAAAGC